MFPQFLQGMDPEQLQKLMAQLSGPKPAAAPSPGGVGSMWTSDAPWKPAATPPANPALPPGQTGPWQPAAAQTPPLAPPQLPQPPAAAPVPTPAANGMGQQQPPKASPFPAMPGQGDFQAGFMSTGPGQQYTKYVNSPEERMAAMGERAFNDRMSFLGGAGLPFASPEEQARQTNINAQLAGQASGQVMQALGGMDDSRMKELVSRIGAGAQLGSAGIAAQAHVEGANAAHSPGAIRGAGILGMMKALGEGQMDPAKAGAMFDLLNRGIGGPPHAGGAPGGADGRKLWEDTAGAMMGSRNAVTNAAGAFGEVKPGPDGQPQITPGEMVGPDQADKLADRLKFASDPDRAAVVAAIQGGKFGDPQKVLQAIATATARAHFQANRMHERNWNTFDSNKRPISANFVGPDQQPIFDLGIGPRNPNLPAAPRLLRQGGVDFDQMRFPDGATLPIDPAALGATIWNGNPLRNPTDVDLQANRGAVLYSLLQRLRQAGK